MSLPFDPGDGERFYRAIRHIPGYPSGEELPIRVMVFEVNALARLPELLIAAGAAPTKPLLVVMDQTPMRRGQDQLKPLLLAQLTAAGWQPEPLWLEPDATGQVHTDFVQIRRVQAKLSTSIGVLAVGAGAVTDITKHACHLYQQAQGTPLPFVVFQTANSVSAYTSNMAPVFVEGVKRTLPSRYPDVLVCDLETLCAAPQAMTAAGVGDLLAAFGSFADWRLAWQLGIDPSYNEFAQTLMGPLDELLLQQAAAIRAATPAGMEVLAKLISLAGLAMSLSHTTAPLSGYEHVISHILDLQAESAQRPLAQHGAQVALATILTTAAYRIFLNEFDPAQLNLERCYPDHATMQRRIQAGFQAVDPSGQVAAECWADYQKKLDSWHTNRGHLQQFLHEWPTHQRRLQAMTRPPELVAQILHAVAAPLQFEALDPPICEKDVHFAFCHAPLMRRRLTLGDLLIFFGWDQEALWQRVWNQMQRYAYET